MNPVLMPSLPHPCLVADIGGTNARFASIAHPGEPLSPMVILATAAHADFADTAREAVAQAHFPQPRSLLVAVAGPVQGRSATLTNARTAGRNLTIDGPKLAEALALKQGLLFNDFEALCLALPVLAPDSLKQLGSRPTTSNGPMLVVGPGTGLGVAALLPDNNRFLPVASEAGHMTIGPQTPQDFALWPYFEESPLTFENLLSGSGLVRLYQATAQKMGLTSPRPTASYVTTSALEKSDAIAVLAVQHFLAILGRFAGDMALAFCATGGVFIGGGIAPRLAKAINESGFRRAFEGDGKASGFLQSISTQLIVTPDAALQGLAAFAQTPGRFRLSYDRRFGNL